MVFSLKEEEIDGNFQFSDVPLTKWADDSLEHSIYKKAMWSS